MWTVSIMVSHYRHWTVKTVDHIFPNPIIALPGVKKQRNCETLNHAYSQYNNMMLSFQRSYFAAYLLQEDIVHDDHGRQVRVGASHHSQLRGLGAWGLRSLLYNRAGWILGVCGVHGAHMLWACIYRPGRRVTINISCIRLEWKQMNAVVWERSNLRIQSLSPSQPGSLQTSWCVVCWLPSSDSLPSS